MLNEECNTLTIKFDGKCASEGTLPLDSFLISLKGWNDFFYIVSSFYINKKLTLYETSNDEKINIHIKAIETGSLETKIIIEAAFAAFLGAKADKLLTIENIRKTFLFTKRFYEFFIEEKRQFKTRKKTADSLKILAKENGLETDDVFDESQHIIDYVDESLKKAANPVSISANTINIINCDENIIIVDSHAKRAISSGFLIDKNDGSTFKAIVQVRQLNLDTGHTTLEVIKSDNDYFTSKADSCYIIDEKLYNPRNPFSQSLDQQTKLDVYVSQIIDKASGKTIRWNISTAPPKINNPLFPGFKEKQQGEQFRAY